MMDRERFTFFWRGPLSQWHPSQFAVGNTEFNCAEQFMMYGKALLFNDLHSAEKILRSPGPREQKALGQKVERFNEKTWRLFREGIVYTGNHAKFTQNPELREILLATKGSTLVEASPYDRIWGIGLAEDDPKAADRSSWRGQNLLGQVLTRVREAIEWEAGLRGRD